MAAMAASHEWGWWDFIGWRGGSGSGGEKRRGSSRVRMGTARGCVGSMTGFVFFAKPRVAAGARRDILWVA